MARTGKPRHVHADLGDDHPRDRLQFLHGGAQRILTPLQRPAALDGRETLSAEEAAQFEASERIRLNRDLFDPETGAPNGTR